MFVSFGVLLNDAFVKGDEQSMVEVWLCTIT